jgi:hypothetical protein
MELSLHYQVMRSDFCKACSGLRTNFLSTWQRHKLLGEVPKTKT